MALIALTTGACNDLLVRPAPAPARLAVGITPGALRAASLGVTNAFDAADSVRVLLVPAPDSLYGRPGQPPSVAEVPANLAQLAVLDVTVPFTPVDSTSISLDVPPVLLLRDSSTVFVVYALMDGTQPLFFGLQVVRIRRGETATAIADTLFASAGTLVAQGPASLQVGTGVKLTVRTFFSTGDTIPAADAILGVRSLSPAVVSARIDPADNTPAIMALQAGTAQVVVEAFGVGGVAADTVTVTVTAIPTGFSSIFAAAGTDHTCGLTPARAAWCWGSGANGQLGHGGTTGTVVPTPVAPPAVGTGTRTAGVLLPLTFRTISAGNGHTCGIDTTGALYCWGANGQGQLGMDGVSGPLLVPTPVPTPAGTTWLSVHAGDAGTCAVTDADFEAYCWGKDVGGRLGLEGDVQTSPASPVHGGYQFREVEMGAWYACGIEATLQVVKCWGSNASGVLGDSTITDSPLPHVVDAPTTFLDLSVGPRHACAIAADRTVWCWGSNGSGQIGNGSTDPVVPNPVQVPGVSDAVVVEVGAEFSCATELTGVLRCWGANDQGQLGIDVNLPHAPPTPANLVGNAGPVAAGAKHTCAPAGNGVLHCWGNGLLGQLGHLAPAISFHPLAVLIPAGSPLPDPAARAASVFRIPLRPSRTQPGAGR